MELLNSSKFASLVGDLMEEHHIPGLSVAVVQDQTVASAGYGSASLDQCVPCTGDTLFDIASSSKSLTAAAVALMVDDDANYPEVRYDSVMSKLLPEDFVMPKDTYTETVTLEDILGHRSGMAAHDDSYMSPRATEPDSPRSITRNLRNLPVAAPLRSRYLYCNMMYTVATHLIEVKSQKRFCDFLREHIFEPLKMRATYLQPSSAISHGHENLMATGYVWNKDESDYTGFPARESPEGQGAGSIITSANDFIKWVKALICEEGPISESIYKGLIRMRTQVNPSYRRLKPYTSPAAYGAGVETFYYRGHLVVGHDGGVPGFASRFFFLPEFKFGAVIMGNSQGVRPVATILMRECLDEVLQIPGPERVYRNRKNVSQKKKNKKKQKAPAAKSQPVGKADESKRQTKAQNGIQQQEAVEAIKSHSSQELSLDSYTGSYTHPGYRTFTLQIKNNQLFLDASDRSMAFTAEFEHLAGQTKFVAHTRDCLDGDDDDVEAEFVLVDGKSVRMGLRLEGALKEFLWFEKGAVE